MAPTRVFANILAVMGARPSYANVSVMAVVSPRSKATSKKLGEAAPTASPPISIAPPAPTASSSPGIEDSPAEANVVAVDIATDLIISPRLPPFMAVSIPDIIGTSHTCPVTAAATLAIVAMSVTGLANPSRKSPISSDKSSKNSPTPPKASPTKSKKPPNPIIAPSAQLIWVLMGTVRVSRHAQTPGP